MKLRLLMATPRFFPYVGGVETHVYEVARRLSKQIDVTVLTTDISHRLPIDENIDGIRVVRVRAWPRRNDLYFAPEIYRYIAGKHWDLIHCQSYHTFVAPLAMAAAQKRGIPFVLTFHSGGHASRLRTRLRRAQTLGLSPLLRRAKKLICVSDFEMRLFSDYLGMSHECFTVIPNGVSLPMDAPSETADFPPLILSVGRLERYKGHHRLIAAMPSLLAQCSDARLLIIGEGPYENDLRQLVSTLGVEQCVEIRSITAQHRSEMPAIYARASVFALMSEYEAYPISVLESLAYRRQVLVADTSGLHELAERGLATAIPLDCSPHETAAALLKLLNSAPPAWVVKLSTWDDCALSLLELYDQVLQGN